MTLQDESHNGEHPQQADATQELKREIKEFVKMIAWFLVLFLIMKNYVIEGYEVQGPSMEPTLLNEDRILVFKLPHKLDQLGLFGDIDAVSPSDIVVFESPEDNVDKRYVKRVIAKGPPGEPRNTVIAGPEGNDATLQRAITVRIEDSHIYVNNHLLEEPYISPKVAGETGTADTVQLGPGEYYVLGDNRGPSKDSRNFKGVNDDLIIGKAVIRFWPPSRFGLIR